MGLLSKGFDQIGILLRSTVLVVDGHTSDRLMPTLKALQQASDASYGNSSYGLKMSQHLRFYLISF